MSDRERYDPGPAVGAELRQAAGNWKLVITRDLRHSPDRVWQALTDPAQLREWAPFDADRNLDATGATAKLTTVGSPSPHVVETTITKADAPKLLEYNWGGQDIRWMLEGIDGGTRLSLEHNIDRNYVAMAAAGWHICFDVLERFLAGQPIGRMVGMDTMKFAGWQRLNTEYATQFGVESPSWPPAASAS